MFFTYKVPTEDVTYQTPGLINKFPKDFSFHEKYREPLSKIKTYFISDYLMLRKNPFEYNFMDFSVEYVDNLVYNYVVEKHNVSGNIVEYIRSNDYFMVSSNAHTSVRYFNEDPSGTLYFKSKLDLAKFKLLLK